MRIFLVNHDETIGQYEILADYFKDRQNEFKITGIISSDIGNTKNTADIINKKLNTKIAYSFKWCGAKEKKQYKESSIEFFERIEKAFKRLLGILSPDDNIVLVTNCDVINIIYSIVNNETWINKNINESILQQNIFLMENSKISTI